MRKLKSAEQEHRTGDDQLIREILARLGDGWTVATLSVLASKRMRFKELYRGIGGISQRMLVVTLRHLERGRLAGANGLPSSSPARGV